MIDIFANLVVAIVALFSFALLCILPLAVIALFVTTAIGSIFGSMWKA